MDARTSALRLPGGTTTTRWLTRGASSSQGWGTALERLLNRDAPLASHCVLDLAQEGVDLESLTDELHPAWDRGLPRIRASLDEARIQLAALGAQPSTGILLLDVMGPTADDRLKKLQSWCKRNEMTLVVRTSVPREHASSPVEIDARSSLAEIANRFLSHGG